METRPWCTIGKCFFYELGRILFLCFFTFQCNSSLLAEDGTGPSDGCNYCSSLADATTVYHSSSSACSQPCPPSSIRLSLETTSQQCSAPTSETTKTDGLQGLRRSLQQGDILDKAAKIILQSWSDGTQKQHKPYIKQWTNFCSERETDPTIHL